MRKLLLATLILVLTSCASIDRGGSQAITINTTDNLDNAKTVCQLRNDSGRWQTAPNREIKIERDSDYLEISCENDTQTGKNIIQADFDSKYLWRDLFLNLCLLSCIIDSANGAFYSYPRLVYIDMIKK